MKKFLNILLAVIMLTVAAVSLVGCSDDATSNARAKGLVVNKNKDTGIYTVVSYNGTEKELDLGKMLKDKGYSGEFKIKKGAFADNATIETLIIPNSVVEIQKGAFEKMIALKSLEVPFVGKTVNADAEYKESAPAEDKSVGSERTLAHFFGADKFKNSVSVTIAGTQCEVPGGFNTITVNATKYFDDPNDVKPEYYSIPYDAFSGATNLKFVTLKGDQLGAIGENAFSGCDYITSITIPVKVKVIHENAFENCDNLKEVKFADGASAIEIKDNAFKGCAKMDTFDSDTAKTVNLSKVSVIGDGALDFGRDAEYSVSGYTGDLAKVFGETKYKQ